MPSTYTYPGVYIQELPSPVHTITAVATSITAFVGYTASGIDNRAQAIYSFSDYERLFGGLATNSELSYAVQQFFQNGGSQAYVVRTPMNYALPTDVRYASVEFGAVGSGVLTFSALSSGVWANGQLLIDIDVQGLKLTGATADPLAFNLTTTNLADGTTEYFPAVSLDNTRQNFVATVINDQDNGSKLVNVVANVPAPTSAAALEVTGILGTDLTGGSGNQLVSAAVNTALGVVTGAASQDCLLTLSIPNASANVTTALTSFRVIRQGAQVAQSVQGLASQLQQAINNVLTLNLPGAFVVCSAAPSGANGTGIRVNASLPGQPDSLVSFTAQPGGGTSIDAGTALGLVAPTSGNVAHYALGTNIPAASGQEISSTPAVAPAGLPLGTDLIGDQLAFTGIYALNKVPIFNLLSIPDASRAAPGAPNSPALAASDYLGVYAAAMALCVQRRAMLLVDPTPDVNTVPGAMDWISNTITSLVNANGDAFFPRLRLPDQLNKNNLRTFAPSGVVAGVYANTDSTRGVWKAPAGIGATLSGVQNMTYQLNDSENGALNPLGLNCFRTFPIYGPVLWGARTLEGADAATNQWKYVPVRRTALFLESSLYQGTQWVVFEPNDEPLWSAIRLNVGAFMQSLFLKGYFQGQTPDEAYFVKCDSETTTQNDINQGVVNILVGFAPLKPAEFVVIQIEQLTGLTGP